MKKIKIAKLIILLFTISAGSAFARTSCNTDCHDRARFRYRCPTFKKPGRKCYGTNKPKEALCRAQKLLSCRNDQHKQVLTIVSKIHGPIKAALMFPVTKHRRELQEDIHKFEFQIANREANERCPHGCYEMGPEERERNAQKSGERIQREMDAMNDKLLQREFNDFCSTDRGYTYNFENGSRSDR